MGIKFVARSRNIVRFSWGSIRSTSSSYFKIAIMRSSKVHFVCSWGFDKRIHGYRFGVPSRSPRNVVYGAHDRSTHARRVHPSSRMPYRRWKLVRLLRRTKQNPEYFEDSQPSNMAPITGIAIEVWSVEGVSNRFEML